MTGGEAQGGSSPPSGSSLSTADTVVLDWAEELERSLHHPLASPRRSKRVSRSGSRIRVIGLLIAIAVAISLFFAVGGFGAVVVALAAGGVLPTGFDGPLLPSGEGRADADLVVMPDPGYRGGPPILEIRQSAPGPTTRSR